MHGPISIFLTFTFNQTIAADSAAAHKRFTFSQFTSFSQLMWSETVALRTRPVSDQKKIGLGLGLGLAGMMLCCETRSCYARRHNDLE